MHRLALTGFLVLTASACGDDGGGGGSETSGSSTGGSSTGGPTSDASASGTTSTTDTPTTDATDPGTTSSDASTSDATDTATGSSTGSDDESSTGGGEFSVTSPEFAEGELFPFNMHICEGNVHPQLDWVNPPAGTMSFGVYFHDVSISFEHSAIWDIPSDATGVPSGIEDVAMPPSVPGALQCQHWADGVGYGGPGSCSNTYQFTVYALDVATLDEVTADSDRFAVRTALEAHAIETTTLSGQTRGADCIPGCTPMME